MIIEYGAHSCRFTEKPDEAVVKQLREMMEYTSEEAKRHAQQQRWRSKGRIQIDPRKYLYHKGQRTFPTGLLDWVEQRIPGVVVQGRPALAAPVPFENPDFTLRPGQAQAVEALLEHPRGAAVLPPGYGKSIVCGVLAARFPGQRVLVTVPAKRLLHQNREEMAAVLGEPVGILGDQEQDLTPRVVVATIQTLALRTEADDVEFHAWLAGVDIWISDEAHGSAADSYRGPSRLMVQAHRRWGLTATWGREDGCDLIMEAVLGPKVFEYPYEAAIADGSLTPPLIILKQAPTTPDRVSISRWVAFYNNKVVENRWRNLRILLDAAAYVDAGLTPCLVMVQRKEHGKMLAKLLQAPFIDGEKATGTVDKVLTAFLAGEFPVLVASSILNVGVNTKALRSAVNAAAGDSRIAIEQKLGRGLRLFPGKERFWFTDYEDAEPHVLRKHSHTRKIVFQRCFPGRVKRAKFETLDELK